MAAKAYFIKEQVVTYVCTIYTSKRDSLVLEDRRVCHTLGGVKDWIKENHDGLKVYGITIITDEIPPVVRNRLQRAQIPIIGELEQKVDS